MDTLPHRHDTTLDNLLEPTSQIYIAPSPLLDRSPETRLSRVERVIAGNPEAAGFQAYEYFANDSAAQKAAFIAAAEGNPTMAHHRLADESGRRDLQFVALAAQNSLITLMGSEADDRTEALFDAVEYRQSEMFLVHMAAIMNDESLPPHERAEAAEWFKLANEALYGVPVNDIFSAIARERLIPHLDADFSDDPEAAEIQRGLRERIGTINDEGYELQTIGPEAQERFDALIHERLDEFVDHMVPRYHIVDGVQVERLYTPDEAVEALNIMLQKMGATALGWRAEKIPGKNY